MKSPRAYASVCLVKNGQFVYILGGLKDYQMLTSIEQYDIMMEQWAELNISMPSRIIKFGCVAINSTEIIVAGGIYGDNKSEQYSYVNSSYKLDLYTNKWSILPKMSIRRVLSSTIPFTPQAKILDNEYVIDAKIYAIGGAFDGSCECFNLNTGKWEHIMGFDKQLKDHDLQTFSVALV
mmetsp:Transcript_40334/g.38804  ORF Transcript_40334/g.38804 Transcript_40334/m.38804 type:complete len:179 (-) Transcript_40334:37-573(-)|eukprot:CAMPEP_0170553290 /NCGR_PEP_ID=MMETSP0211-20121228/11088_1 /TAXON_ID=311385 /ORGANISM="Pseudokeronopsis sp., Strain OXSARD2" /LENGTH=178 /DNA_ID=CAMNT_0010861497 /DNA_START=1900 /DNA_END=2436 /DNA_ORIENTATION=+